MKQYNLKFLSSGKYFQYNLNSKAGQYINEISIFPHFCYFHSFTFKQKVSVYSEWSGTGLERSGFDSDLKLLSASLNV